MGTVAGTQAAPPERAARRFALPGVPTIVAVGATTPKLGVLLNVILGLSRVLPAMGRRGTCPAPSPGRTRPRSWPWSSSGVHRRGPDADRRRADDLVVQRDHPARLLRRHDLGRPRPPHGDRPYGRWLAWAGLAACLLLAFRVERRTWAIGLGVLVVGLAWPQVTVRARGLGAAA